MTPDQLDQIKQRAAILTVAPIVENIVRDVAELPDRTSPDGQPNMMLVAEVELDLIVGRHVDGIVTQACADRTALLAYVARLEAENQSLKDDAWTMYDAVAAVSNMAHVCDTGELCKITDEVLHRIGNRDWMRT